MGADPGGRPLLFTENQRGGPRTAPLLPPFFDAQMGGSFYLPRDGFLL